MTDDDLLKLGFARVEGGVLLAPFGVAVRFTPVGRFFEVSLTVRDGNVITAVVPRGSRLSLPPKLWKRRTEMDPDFLDAVKSLTIAVLDFLGASDGLDDHRIANMNASVFSVLDEASKNPALKLWAEDQRASHEAAMSAFYDKIK